MVPKAPVQESWSSLLLCSVMLVAQSPPGLPSPELALKNSLSGHILISKYLSYLSQG